MTDDAHGPLAPGDRLDRYELICPMAQGGMASVWVGRLQGKHGFEKLVAIKTILPQFAGDARFRAMFLDEARLLSQIQHVNVAQILDMGEERDVLYLVMEFVDGDSLARVLTRVEQKTMPLPTGVLLRVLVDTCMGLHAAHELRDRTTGALLGVVHRDVSPQNILIAQQGTAKLIDFGIAKASGRLAKDTTGDGIKGKIHYMAPEQAARGSRTIDRRADVWAVGAVLYAAYTGRTPYEGDTEIDTLRALVAGRDPAPLGGDAPEALREIGRRATLCNPEARYATALDLGRALEKAMFDLGEHTSQADVAAFLAEHLRDRVDARRSALDFALKAAEDRERVRDVLGPSGPGSVTDALVAAHQRLRGADLVDAEPLPPTGAATPATLPNAAVATRPYEPPTPPRGALASEPPGPFAATRASLGLAPPHAPPRGAPATAYASPPAKASASSPATASAGPPAKAAGSPPAKASGSPAALAFGEVPDLELRAEPPRPLPPPPPKPVAARPSPAPPPIPAARIASAAGGILGPDVMSPGRSPRDEFLDPAAIAAKKASPSSDAPPPISKTYDMLTSGGAPRAIVGDVQAEHKRKAAEADAQRSARVRRWLGIGAILVLALLVAAAAAPSWAKGRVLAAAQMNDLSLGFGRVTVGFGAVHLYDVTVSAADLPRVKMKAAELTIEVGLLDADGIVLRAPEIALEGPLDEVTAALDKLRARAAAAAPKAQRLSLQDARVSWDAPIGAGSRLDADAIHVDLTRGAAALGDELRLTSPNTRLLTSRGLLGPWRIDGERTPKTGRLRVGFDPVLADGPSAILVRTDNGTTATVRVARQPLGRLGIPFALVGLAPSDDTQVEAQMQLTRPLPNRVAGDGRITVYDARVTALSPPLNVVLAGQFAGEPDRPLEVSRGQLSFGPLIARVFGAVTLFDDDVKVDLKWEVPPLPCGVLLNKQSTQTASAEGLLLFDLHRPAQAAFTILQARTCGVPIFTAP